jgi:hypothetical protein
LAVKENPFTVQKSGQRVKDRAAVDNSPTEGENRFVNRIHRQSKKPNPDLQISGLKEGRA